LFGWSQYRPVDWFGRNAEPLTVIAVFTSPAVTSSEMKALTGVGVGLGLGEGDGDGEGLGGGVGDGEDTGEEVGLGVVTGVGVSATKRNHSGSITTTRSNLMRSTVGYITRVATAPTRRTSAPGTAKQGRARDASCA
jgi:hypothetical protein